MKTVVFDFDGTIADSLSVLVESVNKAAKLFRYNQINKAELESLRKLSFSALLEYIQLHPWKLPFVTLYVQRTFYKNVRTIQPFDGMIDLIQDLLSNNIRIFILTANSANVVLEFFKNNNIPYFNKQNVIARTKLYSKRSSKKKAFEIFMKTHNLGPNDFLYVGDELRDILVTQELHIPIVAVTWGYNAETTLKEANPTYIVNTVEELKQSISRYR